MLLLLVVLSAHSAMAQSSRATVDGVVKDSTGALVSDADVRIVSAQQVILGFAKTDAEGRFKFENIPVGSHVLKASRRTSTTNAFYHVSSIIHITRMSFLPSTG